jgi:hypothetical protein
LHAGEKVPCGISDNAPESFVSVPPGKEIGVAGSVNQVKLAGENRAVFRSVEARR